MSEDWIEKKDRLGASIIRTLYEARLLKTWMKDKPEGWTLISGVWSPFYLNLRPIISLPSVYREVTFAMASMIKEECPNCNVLLGIATAGVPLVSSIAWVTSIPACYTRKFENVRSAADLEDWGEHNMVEGLIYSGDNVCLVDDLVTKFDSKAIALEQLKKETEKRNLVNVTCKDVAVLLDRQQGAIVSAGKLEVRLHSLILFRDKGLYWLEDVMDHDEFQVIEDYLHNPDYYQSVDIQKELSDMAG